MAANEDEIRLRLQAETFGYRKAWADVRVQTARDMAAIRSTVTSSLAQTRVNAAQQLAQIRVNTAAQLNQIRQNAQRTLGQMGSQFESAGRRMSVGLTLPLAALGAAAVRSARDIDSSVNVLKAFTGSAEAAEKRLAQLVATARRTPGLTTNLALTLDAQLRTAKVTEEVIDRILPAIGRLNAVQRLEDPARFVDNLKQLVSQNFDRQDLKELAGRSSIAGQIITEIFNVDSPTNAQAIRESARRMGIRTVDDFMAAFAAAVARNPKLANITESIGSQFDKMVDSVKFALRPLGLAIIDAFKPVLDVAVPVIERLGQAFAALPASVRLGVVGVGAFAALMGPTMLLVGSLINTITSLRTAFVALNTLGLLPTITNMRLASQAIQGAGTAAAVSAGGWLGLGGAIVAAAAAVGAFGYALARYTNAGTAAETSTAKWARVLLPILNPLAALTFRLGEGKKGTEELGKAQAGAVPPLKTFTAAVEEESQTLRQLKRALEEAEIATGSRVAAAQRSYNEGLITLRQATAAQADALLEGQKRQLAVIDQGIKESQERLKALEGAAPQGLGPHGADDKDAREEREKLERLTLDRLKLTTETQKKILDLQSELRIKERQLEKERSEETFAALQRGHARVLELFDLQARGYIERQRALAQAEVITHAEAQRRIAAEQARGFEKRRELLEAELGAAKGNAEKEADLIHQLAVLKEQAALFVQEASGAASAAVGSDLDRMIEKVDALLERIDRLREFNLEAPFDTPGVDLSQPIPQGDGPRVDPAGLEPPPPPNIGVFDEIREKWIRLKEELADMSVVNTLSQTLGLVFTGLREAVLGAVDAMIFSGKSLKAALADALKNVLAQTAAFLAKKAWLRAMEAIAEAASHFAMMDFVGGAKWLAAAAAWGALGAGVSALGSMAAGRGQAGALADSGAVGGAARSGDTTTERDRTIRDSRTGGAPDPNQPMNVTVTLNVKSDGSAIVEHVYSDYDRGGKLYTLLRGDLLGEPQAG